MRSTTGRPCSWRRRQSSPSSTAPRRTHSRPPRMRERRNRPHPRVGDGDPDRAAEIDPVGAVVEIDQHRQRMRGAALRARRPRDRFGRLLRDLDRRVHAVQPRRPRAPARGRARRCRGGTRARRPGSGAMRAAIWPPVKVSTTASEPPRSRQRRQHHAFQRLVVLGQDEIAEPLAHLGLHRRELAARYRRPSAPRTVSLVSSCG